MSDTPLPCPFCGQAPTVISETKLSRVGCDNPQCGVNPVVERFWIVTAIAMWNTRAEKAVSA